MITSSGDESVRELLLHIVQAIVDESNAVEIDSCDHEGLTTLNLGVAAGDVGKVIGKHRRTARCLCTIVAVGGMKLHRRYSLNIEEEAL